MGSGVAAPSFDCNKANSDVEHWICQSPALSELDVEIAELYQDWLQRSDYPQPITHEQRHWLKETRNVCRDQQCLEAVMKSRIEELSDFESVASESMQTDDETPLGEAVEAEEAKTTLMEAPDNTHEKVEIKANPGADTVISTTPSTTPASSDKGLLITIGVIALLFVTAIGVRNYANYFAGWTDFILSTSLSVVVVLHLDQYPWAAYAILVYHFAIGTAINGWNLRKGLISLFGRISSLLFLFVVIGACLVYFFTQMKTTNARQRISQGESVNLALFHDRQDSKRQAVAAAASVGIVGTVLFWIGEFFIRNAAAKTGG